MKMSPFGGDEYYNKKEAYDDFQQVGSIDFHIYVGADNHFP